MTGDKIEIHKDHNLPKKMNFCFARQYKTLHEQKFYNFRPFLFILVFSQGFRKSKKNGQWTLGNGGKKTITRSENIMKICKNFFRCGDFTQLVREIVQI